MAKLRHWKQQWDPDAPLEFTKTMRLGIEGAKVVTAGDPVTPLILAGLGHRGKHRLKLWWDAGYIQLSDWTPPEQIRRERASGEVKARIEHVGRGWYSIEGPDGVTEKVRGKGNARCRLAELWEDSDSDSDPDPVEQVDESSAEVDATEQSTEQVVDESSAEVDATEDDPERG